MEEEDKLRKQKKRMGRRREYRLLHCALPPPTKY
jgi:hypothetical protein